MNARREPHHYAILDRQAHPLVVTRVYRLRAALYHPDNKENGDTERFRRVKRPGCSATRSGGPRMTGAVPLIVLGELPGCSVGEAQFILWYVRGKRLIEQTEDRGAITVAGVDCVEANPGDRRPKRRLGVAQPSLPRPCEPLLAGITRHSRVRPH